MKLHILSDVHLEFSAFQSPATEVDVVIMAGDVIKGGVGASWARSAFPCKEITYVSGMSMQSLMKSAPVQEITFAMKRKSLHCASD